MFKHQNLKNHIFSIILHFHFNGRLVVFQGILRVLSVSLNMFYDN